MNYIPTLAIIILYLLFGTNIVFVLLSGYSVFNNCNNNTLTLFLSMLLVYLYGFMYVAHVFLIVGLYYLTVNYNDVRNHWIMLSSMESISKKTNTSDKLMDTVSTIKKILNKLSIVHKILSEKIKNNEHINKLFNYFSKFINYVYNDSIKNFFIKMDNNITSYIESNLIKKSKHNGQIKLDMDLNNEKLMDSMKEMEKLFGNLMENNIKFD